MGTTGADSGHLGLCWPHDISAFGITPGKCMHTRSKATLPGGRILFVCRVLSTIFHSQACTAEELHTHRLSASFTPQTLASTLTLNLTLLQCT
jgi:hypothetical protein